MRSVGLRLAAVALLFAAVALLRPFPGQAQRSYLKITNVVAEEGISGTTVSIAADGSLGKAQTWHDSEGYHVVIPNTTASASLKTGRGLKVRRVGTSLEILVQTKPGAKVNLQSSDNKLHLSIDGKLEPRSTESEFVSAPTWPTETRVLPEPQANSPRPDVPTLQLFSPINETTSNSVAPSSGTVQAPTSPATKTGPQATVASDTSAQAAQPPAVPPSEVAIQPEDDGLLASIFSGYSVLIVMALGLVGLLVSRNLRSRQVTVDKNDSKSEDAQAELAQVAPTPASSNGSAAASLMKSRSESQGSSGLTRQSPSRAAVAGPISLFGAYRIDQEVGKLVYGQPHRLDVLSSRAIDDRRAIETSLIKSVNSPDLDENGRRKAREALEEYGFVARQCAALLLAQDAFDRTSAAQALGEIKSSAALPFLLEGLYDSESIVRNQAVISIGELKLPAAIGALLDIARTHSDVPSALLSRALSACSVEGLDFFDAVMPEPALLGTGLDANIVEQITHLEPTSSVEDLPETIEDERLTQSLYLIASSDVQERAEGLKALAQFRVQNAVQAMALVACNDSEPNLRALAISSLGTINHESVFPAILIGMADEAREVRAAAARSLNRLSFDRSEAYVRVIEISDEATIHSVAQACTQSGIVSQNLDRLATSDHRQAYETFTLICLLAKAKMNEPVLAAIANHTNTDVRIKAAHLLACTGEPELIHQLRALALEDGIREDVRTVLLEGLYKLEQAHPEGISTDAADPDVVAQELELMPDEASATNVAFEHQEEQTPEVELEISPEVETNAFEFGPTFDFEAQAILEEIEE